jgi:hypothetical protein
MTTMFIGNLPAKRNWGDILGKGFSEGLEKAEKDKDGVLATVIQMYREADEKGQEALRNSPGWGKIVEMAAAKGLPLVKVGGSYGFPTKRLTMEEKEAAAAGDDPAAYKARVAGLASEAVGERALRGAQTKYYEESTRAIPREFDLKEREYALKAAELGVKAAAEQGDNLYKQGMLEVSLAKLRQEADQFALTLGLRRQELQAKSREKSAASIARYDEAMKSLSKYKEALREDNLSVPVDRGRAINQMFNEYVGSIRTMNPNNPEDVIHAQALTTDVMLTLVDELTKQDFRSMTKLDKATTTRYLNTIVAATMQGYLPKEIASQILDVLHDAGYDQVEDPKNPGKAIWLFPGDQRPGEGFWEGRSRRNALEAGLGRRR